MPDDVLAGLGVQVEQGRLQYADREVILRVTNDSGSTLTVLGGTLAAPGFGPSTPAKPGRTSVLRAGAHADVYVRLGPAECPGPASPPVPGAAVSSVPGPAALPVPAPAASLTVALGDRTAEGDPVVVVRPVADPGGHLARNHAVDCASAAVGAGARLTVREEVRTEDRDGVPTAVLTIDVEPVAGGPRVEVVRIDRTTLLAVPSGAAAWEGAALAGQADGAIELPVVPARCDQHAVAEDKRGAFVPVHAQVDGVEQHVFHLPMPDDARALLYGFLARACGWTEPVR